MWLLIVFILLWALTKPFYWYLKGVPCLLPLPVLGNSFSSFRLGMIGFYDWLYGKFDGKRFGGFHLFTRPVLIVKDPELITEILIKDHESFASHGFYINPVRDPMGNSVFHLEEEAWKRARSKITPQFTPSKINSMLRMSDRSVRKLIDALDGHNEIDVKSFCTCYTTDFTTGALFGIETDSFDSKSDFYRLTKETFTPESSKTLIVSLISPALFDLLKMTSFSKWANGFIASVIKSILALEKSENSCFVQGIKELKEQGFDDEFIISQATIMYVGGVETSSTSIALCLYELCLNQEIQNRARSEAKGLTPPGYIDTIISETLRKYPQFALLSRKCTRKYVIPGTGVTIDPGTFVAIPAYSIHHDRRYEKMYKLSKPSKEFILEISQK